MEIKMNQKFVNSLVEIIQFLAKEECQMIKEKLFCETNQVTKKELTLHWLKPSGFLRDKNP